MSCNRCVQAVYTALTPVEGISRVELGIGWAEIEHDGRATVDALRDAIGVAGYPVHAEEPSGHARGRSLPLF